MDKSEKIEKIEELLEAVKTLPFKDFTQLDAVQRKTEMLARRFFGESTAYIDDLKQLHFSPMVYPASTDYERESWHSGVSGLENLLRTMREEVLFFEATATESTPKIDSEEQSDAVFIVHGHDEEMKLAVARTLERLNLRPIILHEQPNLGRTIIEKFTDYSNVSFAVVLLSPDDECHADGTLPEEAIGFRARQNVIFELGYFIGRLGRERVVALFRQAENFVLPSDYSGVLYVPFDQGGRWQFDLLKEFRACGYDVDANRLLE
jgi:predicted nucleotide-binding protein